MIVSHSRRFIFLKARKTGGTSVEINLARQCGSRDIVTPVTKFRSSVDETPYIHRPRNYREGAGCYNHMLPKEVRAHVGDGCWYSYFRFTIVRNPWDLLVSQYWWKRGPRKWPFDEFVLRRGPTNRSYYLWPDGSDTSDFYMHYERLDADYRLICKRLGLRYRPLPLTKSRARKSKAHYSTYYTPCLRSHVAKVFDLEIRRFGYRFEDGS